MSAGEVINARKVGPVSCGASNFYTYFHTRNDTNAVFYVGKGCGSRARKTARNNQHWRNIVAKHGHTVHIAALWPTEAEAFDHEKFLIACFRDMKVTLVNRTDGGEGPSGMVHSQKTREQMSAAHSGRPGNATSEATKAKLRAFNTGKTHTDATKAKMSASHTGKTLSPDHVAKVRAALIGHPVSDEARAKISAWQIGRVFTEEHRAKLSAANTGRVVSEATKEKLRVAFTGRVMSAEHRANIGAASRGRKFSDASRAKMSASRKASFLKRKEESNV